MPESGVSASGIVQELVGCDWGRAVTAPDDQEACPNQAVQIVVVHDGPALHDLKLCPLHRDRILAETTPREEGGHS